MNPHQPFWRHRAYNLAMLACALFVLLTFIAMPFYPGKLQADGRRSNYDFFRNFFSELGLFKVEGRPNPVSAPLFFLALTAAGLGLVLFSLAFARLFDRDGWNQALGWIGSAFGVLSGLCFVGVAFTPADLLPEAHGYFVLWAFRLFPVAALFYMVAILRQPNYPKRYALLLGLFAVLLVAYVLLMTQGPAADTDQGRLVQATGQKVIVYASIISVFIQAHGARRRIYLERTPPAGPSAAGRPSQ